ncbi:hypothetical protein [Glutamicibacter sp. NPDC087583]|uniref:terminase small subunit n=1 Tax=Glutamicibacter sp. NPDC087583 TaxID=3363995 RepID=UPI0037F1D3FD
MATPRKPAGKLRTAVLTALRGAQGLTTADAAAKELALTYADGIDSARLTGDPADLTKALHLGPHLLAALKALGCTPDSRTAPAAKVDPAAAALASLQAEGKARAKKK